MSIINKFALLCTAFTAALLTFTPSARALTITDGHQLSFVNYGTASGDRTPYVNRLISIARRTEAEVVHPRPQAVLANDMNSGYANDFREVIPVSRPAALPALGGVPGGTAGVPDGGISAMLLGMALGALGIARRYIIS
jgi:hypothetical protein